MTRGIFIVIEGTDGSGKKEQTLRLNNRLEKEGHRVHAFHFPRYENPSSWFVTQYLNGAFGTLYDVSPRTASLFYAVDRFAARSEMENALESGDIVIADRYVASNIAHQGSKIASLEERKSFVQWDYDIEYRENGIPKPDCNIILLVPPEISQKLVDGKGARAYVGGIKRDIHEADIEHLKNAYEAYRLLPKMYPDEFITIECVENGELLSMEAVHEKVWAVIKGMV